VELSSAGPLLLPDQAGAHPHLVLGAGKNGNLYVVNRDDMGHFNSASDSQIVQSLVDILYKRLSRKLLDGVLLADFAGL